MIKYSQRYGLEKLASSLALLGTKKYKKHFNDAYRYDPAVLAESIFRTLQPWDSDETVFDDSYFESY